MSPVKTALVLAALLALTVATSAKTGDGTSYANPGDPNGTGFNACGFSNSEISKGGNYMSYFAALSFADFDRGKCGQCIRVRSADSSANTGKSVILKVIDACASCSSGDVDMTTKALDDITGLRADRKKVTWEWVDCSSGDSSNSNNDTGGANTRSNDSGPKTRSNSGSNDGNGGSGRWVCPKGKQWGWRNTKAEGHCCEADNTGCVSAIYKGGRKLMASQE